MSELSPTDLARDAFVRRNEKFVLTRASAALVVINLVIVAAFIAATWSSWSEVLRWYLSLLQAAHSAGTMPPPPQVLQRVALFAAPVYVASFVLFAAFEAACLRWLVRGESGGGLFGLGLGADTWRVWLGYWVWLALAAVFCVGVVCFYVALNMIGGAITGIAHILVLLVAALAPLGLIALLLWGATVFAPAAATSIARKRFAFASAPKVSRGRRWALLGAFVLVVVGYLVISAVTQVILRIPIDAAIQPIVLRALGGEDFKSLATALNHALSTPTIAVVAVIYMIWAQVLACVFYVACFGVNARAVRAAIEDGRIEAAP
ncbi:MAG: hypothetical protein QM759_03660 [Terricaulis sp.]